MKSKRIVQEKEEAIKQLQEQFNQYHERLTELKQLSDIDEYVNQNVLSELKKLEIQETSEKSNLDKLIGEITKEIRMLKKELNQRAKTIEGDYEALKNELSILIGSTGITDKKFRNFDKLKGSGTNLNKDLLVIFLVYMNLIDSKSITSLPFAIDSFVKNETDEKVLKKMFDAINLKFLSLKSQTFFSIIRDNLKYVDSKVNQVNIESPLLKREYYSDLSKEII